eukprot:g2439.t1
MAPGFVSKYLKDFLKTLLDQTGTPGTADSFFASGTGQVPKNVTPAEVKKWEAFLADLQELHCTESAPVYEISKFFKHYSGPKATELSEAYRLAHASEEERGNPHVEEEVDADGNRELPADSKLAVFGTEHPVLDKETGKVIVKPGLGASAAGEISDTSVAEQNERLSAAFFDVLRSHVGAAKLFVGETNADKIGDVTVFPRDADIVGGDQKARLDVGVGWDWNRGSEVYRDSSAVRYWHWKTTVEKDRQVEYWRPPEHAQVPDEDWSGRTSGATKSETPVPCRCYGQDILSCKTKLREYVEQHLSYLRMKLAAS